jgi:hypothetical protein
MSSLPSTWGMLWQRPAAKSPHSFPAHNDARIFRGSPARNHNRLIKAVFSQDSNDFLACANRETFAHASATSNTFAPLGSVTGAGSNQSSRASFALGTASSSVSPAEAQPGNSGKNAAQRFVSTSCSTTRRNFMFPIIQHVGRPSKRIAAFKGRCQKEESRKRLRANPPLLKRVASLGPLRPR